MKPVEQSGWRMWAAAAIVAAIFIPSNAPTPLYVGWQAEFGFSTSIITILFGSYVAGLLVSLAFAGQCSDRFGYRPVLLFGLAMAMIACALFASARSLALLLAARLLSGLSTGAAATAGVALVVEFGEADRRRMASAAASFSVVFGAALGPLLAGTMALILDRPAGPIFGTMFVLLIGAAVLVRRLPMRQGARQAKGWRLRFPAVPRANRRHLLSGILAFSCGLSATAFILSLGPSVLRQLTGETSPLVAGVTAGVMFTAGAVVQFPAAKLPTRWMFMASAAALLCAMGLTATAVLERSAPAIIGAAIIGGGGYGLAQLAGLTLIGLHVATERRAEANALFNIGGYCACGLVPILVGLLVDRIGLADGTMLFAGTVAVTAVAACACITLVLMPHEAVNDEGWGQKSPL